MPMICQSDLSEIRTSYYKAALEDELQNLISILVRFSFCLVYAVLERNLFCVKGSFQRQSLDAETKLRNNPLSQP